MQILKDIGCRTIKRLTIGFNGKNYVFPCREFKINEKPGKNVHWDKIADLS